MIGCAQDTPVKVQPRMQARNSGAEIDGEIPRREKQNETAEIAVQERSCQQLEKMRVLPDAWHWPLWGDAEQIHAKEPDQDAGREQTRIAERGIAGDVILPGIDRQASDERHDDRHRRRRGGTSAEETPVFGWRDEIAHPRVPGAAADRRRALVNGKRPD